MDTAAALVIIGAGTAGAELAFAARRGGWPGSIVVLGEESSPPYHRPPLSKAYLSEQFNVGNLLIRPPQAYDKAGITVRTGVRIDSIATQKRLLLTNHGESIHYRKLALCTGGRARRLDVGGLPPGESPSNLHYLRTQADADAIRAGLIQGSRLVVIGGGYAGLEVAASARALGVDVTVLETQPRVLSRVTSHDLSAFYERVHREAGVDLHTGVTVERIECYRTSPDMQTGKGGLVTAVRCADGSRFPADLVVVGIGGIPNTELAAEAGIEVGDGIVVNEFAQTSDPHIYAAGDCTSHPSVTYGRRIRLESVPNALEQAHSAASTLCNKPLAHTSVPWFWSDQYDLKLQMAGLSQGYEQIVFRGSMEARSLSAFYLRGDRLLAVDVVNRPADFIMGKRLIATGTEVTPAQLGDESVPLKAFLQTAA